MYKRVVWFTFQITLLFITVTMTRTLFWNHSTEAVAYTPIRYAFTPEATTASARLQYIQTPVDDMVGAFTVSVAMPPPAAADFAPLIAPTETLQPQPTLVARRSSPTASPTPELTSRETFSRRFRSSRATLSNLTYILNMAAGDGFLDCQQLNQYYEQVTLFYHHSVAEPLGTANDYYIRSLNTLTIGIFPLYDWCLQQLADEPERSVFRIHVITPSNSFSNAVAESNAALTLNTLGLEWLDGSTRLLTELYNRFENQLVAYATAVNLSTADACPAIQQGYVQLVQQSAVLDIAHGSEFYSSHRRYEQALQHIRESGQTLHDFCASDNVEGVSQLIEMRIQLLPMEAMTSARVGIEQAQLLLEEAYFYISSEALDETPDKNTAIDAGQ